MLALIACGAPSADALRDALAEPDPARGIAGCARTGDLHDECVATIVRAHPEVGPGACDGLGARWGAECHFAVAESRAKAGDRWGALVECGSAGAFYDECLYHAWTFELQVAAEGLGRAVSGLERARPIVEFWSQIQTIGPDPEAQLWRDWWYFAHARNKPAHLGWCASLEDVERTRCEDGTRTYVRRLAVETVIRHGTSAGERDRLCRAEPEAARALLSDPYVPEASLDAELVAGLQAACSGSVERPWNPIFRPRRLGAG